MLITCIIYIYSIKIKSILRQHLNVYNKEIYYGKRYISFLGMDNRIDEILELIKIAKNNGYDRIFTSFHIPEPIMRL